MISEGIQNTYPTLHENLRTDVAIIGAGITGALVGHALCQAGVDVVLVDKRHVAHGSTAANTAMLQYEIDVPLFELTQKMGERTARRSYELCSEALTTLGKFCGKVAKQVDFELHPSLLYATYKKHVKEIIEPEFAARAAAGFDVTLLNEKDIADKFGFKAPAGILSTQAAHVNPYLLTNCLLEQVTRLGGRVHELTEVSAIATTTRQVVLSTKNDCTITAKYVIVATGYEAGTFLPTPVGSIHSSYAIVSKPLATKEPWFENALIWETRKPYHYFRTTSDARILVGGHDDNFYSPAKRDSQITRKSQALVRDFTRLFPQIPFEMDFAWAGTFAETKDGLPYVGPCDDKRVLYALGYGGNGITFSVIAADLLRDRIVGTKNPDAGIFGFNRQTI
jgi:glycine/D-amino acid oxidase-like deaminating enzyme